jgi:hypothetical protein
MSGRRIIQFSFREVGMRNPELWVLCDDGTMWMKPTKVPVHVGEIDCPTSEVAQRNSWKRVHLPSEIFSQSGSFGSRIGGGVQ